MHQFMQNEAAPCVPFAAAIHQLQLKAGGSAKLHDRRGRHHKYFRPCYG